MNSLLSRALELQRIAHELMCFGMDGTPVYSDTFCRLNKEVLVLSDYLSPFKVLVPKRRLMYVWLS